VAVLAASLKDRRNIPGKRDVFRIDAEIGRSEKMWLMIGDTGVVTLSVQGDRHHQKGHSWNYEKMSDVHHKLPLENVPNKSIEK
jgi:hypothetical protein